MAEIAKKLSELEIGKPEERKKGMKEEEEEKEEEKEEIFQTLSLKQHSSLGVTGLEGLGGLAGGRS